MFSKTIVRVAATVEPVTLDEAKAQMRVDTTTEDDHIQNLISQARDHCEQYCNRYFTTQQITIYYDEGFSVGDLALPYPDLVSVQSVEYTDSDNEIQTVDNIEYSFDGDAQLLRLDGSWPSDAKDIRVNCTTGAPVEFEGVKIAILMIVTDRDLTRTETVIGSTVTENPAVKAHLYPYRNNLGVL